MNHLKVITADRAFVLQGIDLEAAPGELICSVPVKRRATNFISFIDGLEGKSLNS